MASTLQQYFENTYGNGTQVSLKQGTPQNSLYVRLRSALGVCEVHYREDLLHNISVRFQKIGIMTLSTFESLTQAEKDELEEFTKGIENVCGHGYISKV